jgi:hypothetical protein
MMGAAQSASPHAQCAVTVGSRLMSGGWYCAIARVAAPTMAKARRTWRVIVLFLLVQLMVMLRTQLSQTVVACCWLSVGVSRVDTQRVQRVAFRGAWHRLQTLPILHDRGEIGAGNEEELRGGGGESVAPIVYYSHT